MRSWFGMGSIAKGMIGIVLLGLAGCQDRDDTGPESSQTFRGLTLTVAAVGDPAILESVRVQSGDWEREHGASIRIHSEPIKPEQARSADVLIFPGDRLGALIDADALTVLDESAVRPMNTLPVGQPSAATPDDLPAGPAVRSDSLDFADVSQVYREQVTQYGDDRIGLPLGGSVLVLAYRRDALESKANRQAAESAGLKLEPPTTWEQLDALARFFQGRDWDGDGMHESGIALALGDDPEGVGDAIFLARAASLGQAPDRYEFLFDSETMAPRITSPPFIEALKALAALQEAGPESIASFDAEKAREAFRAGEAVLLIDRAERAAFWTSTENPFPVAVARLPGASRYYDPSRQDWRESDRLNRPSYLPCGGGWLIGVSSQANGTRREAAISYLRSLAGPELAQAIVSDRVFPMVPVRASHLAFGLPDPRSAPSIETRSWGQAVLQTFTAPQVVVGLRIPGADGYLADLARARVAAVGGQPAQEALNTAAHSWEERTTAFGQERQRWHYRRSLNRLSTAPQPPSRSSKVATEAESASE